MRVSLAFALVGLVLSGCSHVVRSQVSASDQDLPAGYGTLRQDDLAVRIRTPDLDIRFVPLAERATRLLAPDAYASMHGLVASNHRTIDSIATANGVSRPGLALVSFFGGSPGVRFDPTLVTLTIRNRLVLPIGTISLSPQFASQQLDVRGQASGIYVFGEDIPIEEPFAVSYGTATSNEWERKTEVLNRERARVTGRARSATVRDTAR